MRAAYLRLLLLGLGLGLAAPPLAAGEKRDRRDEEQERPSAKRPSKRQEQTPSPTPSAAPAASGAAEAGGIEEVLRRAGLDPAREISAGRSGQLQLSTAARRALRDAGIALGDAREQLALRRLLDDAARQGGVRPVIDPAAPPRTHGELLLLFLEALGLPREQAVGEETDRRGEVRRSLTDAGRERLAAAGFDVRDAQRRWDEPVDPVLLELLEDPLAGGAPVAEEGELAPLPEGARGEDLATAERLIAEATSLRHSGRHRSAAQYYERALAIILPLVRREARSELCLDLARAEHGLGSISLVASQYGEAWRHYRNSVFWFERGGFQQKIVLSGSQARVSQMEQKLRERGERVPEWRAPL